MSILSKNERFYKKTAIDNLFEKGSSIYTPVFRLVWDIQEDVNCAKIQRLIIVPKKKIKKAVDRNLLKRRIREAFRLHKINLQNRIDNNKKSLQLAVIYQKTEMIEYKLIEKEIKVVLMRLNEAV